MNEAVQAGQQKYYDMYVAAKYIVEGATLRYIKTKTLYYDNMMNVAVANNDDSKDVDE